MSFHFIHLPVVDSTNTYLRSLVDAPEWTCVTAERQTAGRGRQNRQWYSESGVGLYLSVLLRPSERLSPLSLISLVAAIAVAETLIKLDVTGIDIKWPNDLLVGGRKISGILVESTGLVTDGLPRVIVGIGVNLNQRSFPPDLEDRATSLFNQLGSETRPETFRDQLLERLSVWYCHWRDGRVEQILSRWLALSTFGCDREVVVKHDHKVLTGHTNGLTPDGALLLRTADGSVHTIVAGDVTSLRPIVPAIVPVK